MTRLHVQLFQPSQWVLYRALRLSALKDSPDSFGGTYAEARLHPDSVWIERLSDADADFDLPLLVKAEDDAAGMAWGKIEPATPEVAHLYQMWVAPHHRGLGAGKLMLNRVISWARERRAQQLLLAVTCGSSPARRIYERVGFLPVGEPEPLRLGSNKLVQPMRLELDI